MTTCTNASGKARFKNHLAKLGSGKNTSRGLSREESADALHLMLCGEASAAQIGAFMIAHRIRRPEPQELAGMLDTYMKLGPSLKSKAGQRRPICFGMPFDGRTKTAPIYPLTALILLTAGQPVVLHGGKRMPTKYGVTGEELFQALGLNVKGLPIKETEDCFKNNGFGYIYQPDHFPLAEKLILYREEIGKRPPLASMELLWNAHKGEHLLVSGFLHPPTESRALETLDLLKEIDVITIKGLEGGTDLPISHTCITSRRKQKASERIFLYPKDFNCAGKDIQWIDIYQWKIHAIEALSNRGPYARSLRWNSGVYLWFSGISSNIKEGIEQADFYMRSELARETLENLIGWRKSVQELAR